MSKVSHIKPHIWFTLYALLKLGASKTSIHISTARLSQETGGSQQNASRHLLELEGLGFITRETSSRGSRVRITPLGVSELDRVLQSLKWHIEEKKAEIIVITGVVTRGLFEGAYYISKEGYMRQIKEKLGFEAFPGTLNIEIKEEMYERRRRLEGRSSIRLEGFKDGERSFGAAHCYPCIINGMEEGALIVAERSIHDIDVLEIIAPNYLRRKLGLVDGDTVRIEFLPPPLCDA